MPQAARKHPAAIVFIDEVDAVAKGRDSKLRSLGNDEREQTLNQLLTELDGFDSTPGRGRIGRRGWGGYGRTNAGCKCT